MPSSGLLLAKRYAKALFELAEKKQKLDDVAKEVQLLKELLDLEESDEIKRALASPVLAGHQKEAVLTNLAKQMKLSPLVYHFLLTILKNGRLAELPLMIDGFMDLVATHRGEVKADVVSAQPLTPKQIESLETKLSQVYEAPVKVNLSVDPSILGGLIVTIGSKRWDDSLVEKINRMHMLNKQAIATI